MNSNFSQLETGLPKYVEIIYKNIKHFVSETSSDETSNGDFFEYNVVRNKDDIVIIRKHYSSDKTVCDFLDFFYPLYNSNQAINPQKLSNISEQFQNFETEAKLKKSYLSLLNKDGTVIHILMNKL